MFEPTVPNLLTLFRILLVPVLVAALLSGLEIGDLLAAVVFVVASITDALDGWIARRNRDVTTFGKLMDPLADKLLVTSALVSLVALDRLQAWVAMVIIAREFAVTGLRQLAMEHGEVIHALEEVDLQARIVGDTAVTFVVLDVRGTIGGDDVSGRMRYTRTWVREDGRWRVVGGHIPPAARLSDGR